MKKNNSLLMAAVTGLLLTGCATQPTGTSTKAEAQSVMCYGVNSCKGAGQCAGKVDACSGKDGCDAKVSCSGKNACKGKGLLKMTKKECTDKGGKAAS